MHRRPDAPTSDHPLRHVGAHALRWLAFALALGSHTWVAAQTTPGVASGKQEAAAEAPDARRDRLRGLSSQDLAALSPYLAHGPAALIEFTHHPDALPAVNVAVAVSAPLDTVVDTIAAPERYPRFIGTVDEVTVARRDAHTVVYDWDWSMAVFRMHGRNVMRIYRPAPGGDDSRGARITVDNQSGDMGTGRTSMRVLPQPGGGCLLVLSMRLDLRDANYVARRMSRAARSMNRSANMALTYALALGIRAEAERRAGLHTPAPPTDGAEPLVAPHVARRSMDRLMHRGDVVLMDLWGDAPGRVTILGHVHRGADVVRQVMLDAEGFGAALIPGSGATVVSKAATHTIFDWEIGLPLIGIEGRMRLDHDKPQEVGLSATDGALRGGQWHFYTEPRGRRRSFVMGWARFDLTRTNFLLRQLIEADRDLGFGLEAASEVMLMRALRTRARKRPVSELEKAKRSPRKRASKRKRSPKPTPAQAATDGRDSGQLAKRPEPKPANPAASP